MIHFVKLLPSISLLFVLINSYIAADFDHSPVTYQFIDEPIDVVIPVGSKDQITLQYCIEGVKNNCKNLRRIIVVSSQRLSDEAEWFDENHYPFSKNDIALYLNGLDRDRTSAYMSHSSRIGWYLQQLLKLYAPYVIPGISSNVLVVDADTVFFRPIEFINEEGGGNYVVGHEYHIPYFEHAHRLLPGLRRLNHSLSGITHHMLFQKPVLDDLFNQVETFHQTEFWKAFCLCASANPQHLHFSGASEYEIYFNFAFARTQQVRIRALNWANSGALHELQQHKNAGYDFVSYHSWMRG